MEIPEKLLKSIKKEKVLVTFSHSLNNRSSQIEFEKDELIKILNNKETRFDIRPDDRKENAGGNILVNIAGDKKYITALWKPDEDSLVITKIENFIDKKFFYEEALKRGESLDWVEFSKSVVIDRYSMTKYFNEIRDKKRKILGLEKFKEDETLIGVIFTKETEKSAEDTIIELNSSACPPIFRVYGNQLQEEKISVYILTEKFYYTGYWDINKKKLVVTDCRENRSLRIDRSVLS